MFRLSPGVGGSSRDEHGDSGEEMGGVSRRETGGGHKEQCSLSQTPLHFPTPAPLGRFVVAGWVEWGCGTGRSGWRGQARAPRSCLGPVPVPVPVPEPVPVPIPVPAPAPALVLAPVLVLVLVPALIACIPCTRS